MIPDNPRRAARIVTNALALLVPLLVAAIVYLVAHGINQDANATQAKQALCTLRADEVARVKSATDLLAQHPTGIAGIPAASIQQSINSQTRTIKALAVLDC